MGNSTETKKIANVQCQKAKVTYSGRNWTAWFTPEIPVSEGPYYFHGLPGLIVQIEDDKENFSFTATKIDEGFTTILYSTKAGIELSWEQYNAQLKSNFRNPYSSVTVQGKKVYKDNGSGGYQEIDYRERIIANQEEQLRNNNYIELLHAVDLK